MSYTKNDLSVMTITKLKEICKENKISGCYKFKSADKEELVELILQSLKAKPASPKPASPRPSSPPTKTVISKSELAKMTVKQLKDLLQGCGQSTSGLKAELVDRVYTFCKDKLSKTPVSPKKTSLTVKELKELLSKKNIKHYNPKLKKADLEYLSNTKTCNPDTNEFCGTGEVCDLRDGICTKPEYISGDVVEATVQGHKIIGNRALIDKILSKVGAASPVKAASPKGRASKKDLVQELEKRGIKHSLGLSLKKEQLEYLVNATKCDPVKGKGCSGDEVCDLRDGICTKPEYMKKGIVQSEINGIKVTGDKEIIESMLKRLKKKEPEFVITPPKLIPEERDDGTTFIQPPVQIFPPLPKIDIPQIPKFLQEPVPRPVSPKAVKQMPKITPKMIKSLSGMNVSNIDERIKASLGLTTL